MQLGIAARQINGIGIHGRRLVGERRKEGEACARRAPAEQQMLVDEGEGRVARDGDALAKWRQEGNGRHGRQGMTCSHGQQTVDIAAGSDGLCRAGDKALKTAMFTGLHETEMTLRQSKPIFPLQHAKNLDAAGIQRAAQHHLVFSAADLVEDDARHADIAAEIGIALHHGGDGLRQTAAIDDQDDRQAECRSEIGR